MCGIVGYIGKQETLPILLDGLKNLEYRGYDSAGIAVFKDGRASALRSIGKVSELESRIALARENFSGNMGIAHTRWATHGSVTEANAHPHTDCAKNIFLAHNGIIENYKELKAQLVQSGHTFYSETDTETLAHLLEEEKGKENVPLEEALRRTLLKVRGTYGVVAFDVREPQKIVAARNFSPLILGIGKDEYVIASDATAIMNLTDHVVYIKDGEIVVLRPDAYRIITIANQPVSREAEKLEWDIKTTQKGGYPHFMIKEIHEQPEAIQNSIRGRLIAEEGKAVLGGLKDIEDQLRHIDRLLIVGCGTANYAGRVGEYMLEEYAGVPTEVDSASEFRYRKPIFGEHDVVLAISQSGETADTLGALGEAKEKGVLTLGVVNVVGSSVSRATDAGVYQHIGPEVSVASTKAFASQVAIMALLTLFLGRKRAMSLVTGKRIASELERIPALMERTFQEEAHIQKLAKKYARYHNFLFLGRKYNLPVALEGALKLKEVSYVHAEGMPAGEMKHGSIAMIDSAMPSIMLVPKDSVYEKMISSMEEIKARGGPILAIATEGDEKIRDIADDVIFIPKTLEMLTPLLSVIPLQLFAYYVAVERGCEVDRPRNLAKSVTVE